MAREQIVGLNAQWPQFPLLQIKHLRDGYWWLAYEHDEVVGFAGMVPFIPVEKYGYFKRCFIVPEHRGNGLQSLLMTLRINMARSIGWTHLLGDCAIDNAYSAQNFVKAGFELTEPEQPWCRDPSLYFIKDLGRAVA
jgi:GNAT superfamily N-acetyltransferase